MLETLFNSENKAITLHLFGALLAGGLIGLERSYHGRPAGVRTHMLVCVSSSLLMLVALYQSAWLPAALHGSMRTDPTRMAQGVMTGIGFLGAGVIFREGLSVRGLTTAASLWLTAAVGILIGVGFYFPALLATAMALGILSLFHWIEDRIPSQLYAHHHIRFDRDYVMPEGELRALLVGHGFAVVNMSYRVTNGGRAFEYRMVLRTLDARNHGKLSDSLRKMDSVKEFRISPTGD